MLNSGLMDHFGASSCVMELELLTDSGQFVWVWDASDPVVARVAAGTVRRAAEGWHDGHELEDRARSVLCMVSRSSMVS